MRASTRPAPAVSLKPRMPAHAGVRRRGPRNAAGRTAKEWDDDMSDERGPDGRQVEHGGGTVPSRPVQVVCDGFLGRLRVWSDAEWAVPAEGERPARHEHVPGLGWVGVVRSVGLN